MKRVVVPLDGTDLAAAILPDARRLAGPDGELILVREAKAIPYYGEAYLEAQNDAIEASGVYLGKMADSLRADGMRVRTQTTVIGDTALAIDEAARIFHADMIAVATHGRGTIGRLVRGGVAWRALAHSPVPVLVRHVHKNGERPLQLPLFRRSMLVPLDGSPLAEKALPLARDLEREWNAEIRLVQVVPSIAYGGAFDMGPVVYGDASEACQEAGAYITRIAETLEGTVHKHVLVGSPIEALVAAAEAWNVTDIVMASHGRAGLSRVILGSIADALIQRLDVPIVVVPALAAESLDGSTLRARRDEMAATPV